MKTELTEAPGAGRVHLGVWVDLYSKEYGAKIYRGFTHQEWLELRAALLAVPAPGRLEAARLDLEEHRASHPPQPSTLLPTSKSCNDPKWYILETLVATLERGSLN